ncbi:SRSF protein kinase 3-like isoform X2 [Phlebotomus argentipes]|uniref:SRSF protein kinase 3-like isoform X2 n=1 Tax=Phlebotomus argentipes TaxID=94469 RepID=UPI002892C671|nr:SRSF protein kinase 3-like isoform X2 [Phlebotomus argentipes]XP_059611583.1 SRSF protein kinase 3-like isoform X2 [Phlebotomus argentipes]XP_059611592.1 SRSF protein kinase 3-like isoform X2 [Phlebotomus argentipes]XP_059611602.1 SRSF protein kinase 3-like isoform X2 [Phlebotomus argentipes]
MVWMKRILTQETTDYCKTSTLAPVLPQANTISSTSAALGSAIVISSSGSQTSSRTTSPLLFQALPPPPPPLLHNHRSTIEEVALKNCLATIRCSVASPQITFPPPSPLNRSCPAEPFTVTPFYHHPRRFPRFQTLLGERVASSSAISTPSGHLFLSSVDLALGKAQQQDFLSLSLSPPLNRRRDMPALRGPFVSLSEPRSGTTDEPYAESPDSSLYGSDEEQEDVSQYCRGGYHPIVIGDVFDNRYRVVRKLGWGHFSTVWLCWDIEDEKYVALKVVKSAPHYTETATDEIHLLEVISTADPFDLNRDKIVRLLNNFTVRGVNGVHTCLVFEALGCSLYKLIVKNNYQGLPLHLVRSVIKQMLQGLDYLHTKCHIIHTDVKPENILLVMDNVAVVNQQIDDEIMSMRARGVEFPDSYVSAFEKRSLNRSSIEEDLLKSTPISSSGTSKQTTGTTSIDISSPSEEEGVSVGADRGVAANMMAFRQQSSLEDFVDNSGAAAMAGILTGSDFPGRYRVERRSSQAQLAKLELAALNERTGTTSELTKDQTKAYMPSTQSYSSTLQSIINGNSIRVKIADLGNACYDYHHFTEDIQTRQYRSVEVLLGAPYNFTADIWSTACLAFELATGDYLFDPHAGDNYTRDEDHLAHIIELLGNIPPSLIFRGKHGNKYFTSTGHLRNILKLKPWGLQNVLIEKYEWDPIEARDFTDFLLPMLHFNPILRASAAQCLKHPWLE